MKYLNETGRINQHPDMIIDTLIVEIGLVYSNNSIERIVSQAIHLDFTCDPFDRVIVANAYINNSCLISKDQNIRKNYKLQFGEILINRNELNVSSKKNVIQLNQALNRVA
jgi:PIN domain nuclease of toxin-antitoxin system